MIKAIIATIGIQYLMRNKTALEELPQRSVILSPHGVSLNAGFLP